MVFDTTSSIFHKYEHLDFTLECWLLNWYPRIVDYLKISKERDKKSLQYINEQNLFPEKKQTISQLIKERSVYIFAPGPSLVQQGTKILSELEKNVPIIAVDGATSFLLSKNIVPTLIVTDLDGLIKDQIKAQKRGSLMICHTHGDNISLLQKHMPKIQENKFILTTQLSPTENVYNFLGFTDGDRAVCLAAKQKVTSISLVGFDFGTKIGPYSKPGPLVRTKKKMKLRKFDIAKSIINWCENNTEIGISLF